VTVKVSLGEMMLPKVAVIELVPAVMPVASPWELGVLLMLATLVSEDDHITREVITCVD
jgi:hypothetical protein